MSGKKTATVVIMTIIFSIVIVSLVNLGISLFMDRPNWDDYRCEEYEPYTEVPNAPANVCNEKNTDAREVCCKDKGYDQYYDMEGRCASGCPAVSLQQASEKYDLTKFYIIVILGFGMILVGLFIPEPIMKFTGLAAGGALVAEAIMLNLENKVMVFVTLFLLLIVGIIATLKLMKRFK